MKELLLVLIAQCQSIIPRVNGSSGLCPLVNGLNSYRDEVSQNPELGKVLAEILTYEDCYYTIYGLKFYKDPITGIVQRHTEAWRLDRVELLNDIICEAKEMIAVVDKRDKLIHLIQQCNRVLPKLDVEDGICCHLTHKDKELEKAVDACVEESSYFVHIDEPLWGTSYTAGPYYMCPIKGKVKMGTKAWKQVRVDLLINIRKEASKQLISLS